jgi:signal transduction histidine kinase
MSRQVLTASADQTLERAAQSMTERRVGAVVVTQGPSVVGIVTERDVLRSVARGLVPWSDTLEACMTHDPISITPTTETLAASRLMSEGGFRHLPVLEDGRLVGILSLRDLWRATEAERILQAKEEERRRLAAEIHDGVSQELISIGYRLKACERLLGSDSLGALGELVAADELIDHALKDVRVAIHALRPSPVDELGMIPAVQALARRTFGPEVEVVLTGSLDTRVTPEMESALYRIIQEVLNNVRKHAEARCVTVRIEPGEDRLSIRMTDDGKAFDVDRYRRARPESSFGLMGIVERVGRLGGRLDIQSEVGTGTRVEVVVPLSQRASGPDETG